MESDNANRDDEHLADLGNLQRQIVQVVWDNAPVTAETVREKLSRPLKESTVRTVLRRLEEKGYITHTVDGRTYVYDVGRAARAGRRQSSTAHCRLDLQRIGRGGAGGNGRLEHDRSEATAHAARQDGPAEEGTKMMLDC